MRVIIVGGSASNVGKTTLAAQLVSHERTGCAAMKVSVTESDVPTRVLVEHDSFDEGHGDTAKLLAAGALAVVWVTVSRPRVREGLAVGLSRVRALRPAVLVIESTSAGIHLRRFEESWFVAGPQPWKPWAIAHMKRATNVLDRTGTLNLPPAAAAS